MPNINRREFSQLAIALGASVRSFGGGLSIDDTLRSGMERRKIPAVTAVVATDSKITYQGAFGMRDSASGVKVAPDSIFAIASMTKAVTSVAAMHRDLIEYSTVLQGQQNTTYQLPGTQTNIVPYTHRHECRGTAANTNTGISRILVSARFLRRAAGRALRSSVLSAQKQALVRYRQRQNYTRRTPRSPPALARRCDRRTPTRLSRLAEVPYLDVDVVNLHLWYRVPMCRLPL